MPVILEPAQGGARLDTNTTEIEEFLALLEPFPPHQLEAYSVSRQSQLGQIRLPRFNPENLNLDAAGGDDT